MHRQFWGSTLALALGIFLVFSIFAPADKNPDSGDGFFIGVMIIIGALTYKSVKKRTLGIVKNTNIRQIAEVTGLIIIFVLAVFHKHHLFLSYMILVWTVSSYLIVRQKSKDTTGQNQDGPLC